jgi:DeoR/GlpR family transcriptional regulator of sugar metabolism
MSNIEPQPSVPAAEARRQQIMRLLLERETITVRELTGRFRVSAMTVHRDLDALQARGILRKVYGGATAQPSGLYESSLAFRLGSMSAAKRAIARRAAQRVAPGSSVILDDSTTALELVPFLARIPQLTIVTNFLSVAERLAAARDVDTKLIVVGGAYDPKYHSLLGIVAEQTLLELRVDLCFLSVPAVDVRNGAFHQEPHQARVKRRMTEVAASSTLLVDSSKLGKQALHRIVGLDAFDCVIVDEAAPAADVEALRESVAHVEIARAGVHDEEADVHS